MVMDGNGISGAETVMQMGELVKKGVDVYLLRSMPVIFVVVVVVASASWHVLGSVDLVHFEAGKPWET